MKATINMNDADVAQVAAALADARHAGGLSGDYYRKADDALKRLAGRVLPRAGDPDAANRDEKGRCVECGCAASAGCSTCEARARSVAALGKEQA